LKDYFTIEKEVTKVNIKAIQYSAIGIALVFCINKIFFLPPEYERRQKGAMEGRGQLMWFSTSTRIVKTIQLFSPTIVVNSLLR